MKLTSLVNVESEEVVSLVELLLVDQAECYNKEKERAESTSTPGVKVRSRGDRRRSGRSAKTKNKESFRKFKWATIRGATGVAAFALSTKLISITILNVLIGICAAAVVRKVVGILRLWEYRHFLKNLKKYIPVLKKEMSRREFITLKMFTFKNA